MGSKSTLELNLFIEKEKEGSYIELPFKVPDCVQRIDIKYKYQRFNTAVSGSIKRIDEINTIDFALASNKGDFIGSSGAYREHIWISEHHASDGYAPVKTEAGTWTIIAGAYKVHENGAAVAYEVTFVFKERMLLKGDCHVHTTGSDGILPVEGIMNLAKAESLDFVVLTDHNNYSHNCYTKGDEALTVIPGVEWTHFKGHANMMGADRAFYGKYYANTIEEVNEILDEARERGAVISINHPFDSNCPWKWGLENVEFDCIEVWNGVIKQSDMQCILWWHKKLCSGRHLPIIGGSDFHRFIDFSMLGHPATWVYSMSRGPSDIMEAIKKGHAFVTFQPEAPTADIRCRDWAMGDEIPFVDKLTVYFEFACLKKGDTIKIYSAAGLEKEITAQQGCLSLEINAENKFFYRAEIYRQMLPYLPPMLCLITNPIYFTRDNYINGNNDYT